MSKKNEKAIMFIVGEMGSRYHGEIFMEFFNDNPPYSVESFIDELREYSLDPDEAWNIEMHKAIEDGDYEKAITGYFTQNNGHGEYAGLAIKGCLNDGNLRLAKEICKLTEDWDS